MNTVLLASGSGSRIATALYETWGCLFGFKVLGGRNEVMDPKAVKVPVTASIPVDCIFWTDPDGWTGTCAQLSLTIYGSTFEEAKKNMEEKLVAAINGLVRERKAA